MTATTATDLTECACPEGTALAAGRLGATRRGVLGAAALAGMSTMFGSTVVTMTSAPAAAAPATGRPVVVVISLRGAADGLSLVVPHGDPAYYAARPGIAVPRESLLARDGFFGLHPALAPLLPLWSSGRLAAVHATGLPVANRSHFSAMEELEDADPGSAARVGWLNRMVGADTGTGALQAVAVGSSLPTALLGPETVMSFRTLDAAVVAGDDKWDTHGTRLKSLRTLWGAGGRELGGGMRTALGAVVDLDAAKAQADRAASYPSSDLGKGLASVARTLRADLGVTAVTIDTQSWDMHVGMGTATSGWMVRNTTELANAVAAFFADLGPVGDRVTLVTVSEFGRRVQENANQGLDHGWGNVMLVAGAGVKGGRYYGTWPGLQNTLDADLAVTTDYRSVLAEVVAARTSASTAAVFPGFQRERVGVMVGQ
ncbi:MAG TPA: DUF1501 domain-containing protein [Nocardioides sp.]|uniref:DUF1501 domain-containing protein n=1 Tax=Nocardioides sp. TaxID=35761 RepID=UPI002BE55F45|nr:DUF1501 domain-containing protein [Nocardioides sp.]HTW17538.1 DUF1501 domain-containing protein [Nocardioides sp.]